MRPRRWIFSLICLALLVPMLSILVKLINRPAWDAVYVVNLDRRPDRYNKVHELLNKYGIQHTRFSAVDGYKLIFKDLAKSDPLKKKPASSLVFYPFIPGAAFKYYKVRFRAAGPLTSGEFGCIYSHRAIWQDIVKKGHKLTIIFEDDIIGISDLGVGLSELFKNWPEDADLVYIDFLYFSSPKKRFIEDRKRLSPSVNGMFVSSIPNARIWGTHAYAVTLKGAQKLLKITEVSPFPVDVAMDFAANKGKIKAYMSVKRILKNQWKDSDVTKMGRNV